jgi:energy-coupling factor transporter transmembrane protein EcfT
VKNLTNSIILLLAYLFLVLGLAQIRSFESHVVYFQAAFFIMMTIAVFAGVFPLGRYRPPLYSFLVLWMVVYLLTWELYWRYQASPPGASEVAIQFLLLEVAAGLAHNVGSALAEFDFLFDGLSSQMYPNRTLELGSAGDRIQTELTRSRRYNRPLSVLIVRVQDEGKEKYHGRFERLESDLFQRFTMAKLGQIINGQARQTDLIMRDSAGRFVILCPETDAEECRNLAVRIQKGVVEELEDEVAWGIASFPEETLEFNDLLQKALQRVQNAGEAEPLAKVKRAQPDEERVGPLVR